MNTVILLINEINNILSRFLNNLIVNELYSRYNENEIECVNCLLRLRSIAI